MLGKLQEAANMTPGGIRGGVRKRGNRAGGAGGRGCVEATGNWYGWVEVIGRITCKRVSDRIQ